MVGGYAAESYFQVYTLQDGRTEDSHRSLPMLKGIEIAKCPLTGLETSRKCPTEKRKYRSVTRKDIPVYVAQKKPEDMKVSEQTHMPEDR